MRLLLKYPFFYNLFLRLLGSAENRKNFVKKYIQSADGAKILDIGCGTAEILNYLPENCNYIGFDQSSEYIAFAKDKYNTRGKFHCADISSYNAENLANFDIVLAIGVIHHLDDDEALRLFEIAHKALKKGGRLISMDGCFTEKQSYLKRFILKADRGKYVRDADGYLQIARKQFENQEVNIVEKSGILPYTYIIMTCKK